MKTRKFIWLMMAIGLMAACTDEDIAPNSPQPGKNENAMGIITIASEDLVPVDMNKSRGGEMNGILSRIFDLNIRLHLLGQTETVNYYCKDNTILINGNTAAAEDYYIGDNKLSNFNGNPSPNKSIQLHTKELAKNIEWVEVIANANKDLSTSTSSQGTNWDEIVEEDDSHLYDRNGAYCMMYGKTKLKNDTKPAHNGMICQNFNVLLKRSRAMITVEMVDNGLNKNVTITPMKMRLCNVPMKCYLTKLKSNFGLDPIGTNKIEVAAGNVNIDDISVPYAEEYDLALPDGTYAPLSSKPTGQHIAIDNEGNGTIPENFKPMYLFENMQGIHKPKVNQETSKSPNSSLTVEQLKLRENNYPYSYVEIEAAYEQKDNKTNSLKVSGTIIYRFFLGEDNVEDFNVGGNHYYKLTMNLKNYGGADEDGRLNGEQIIVGDLKEDVSWRVDMNLKDWGFVRDRFDFDSHFFNTFIKVVGENWAFNRVWYIDDHGNRVEGGGDRSWLVIKIKEPNELGTSYTNPTNIAKNDKLHLEIVNGELKFQVQPMQYGGGDDLVDPAGFFGMNTWKNPNARHYRELQIEVIQTGVAAPKTQVVTVRQWVPIGLTTASGHNFFAERFEEVYPGTIGWPWKFKGDNLSQRKDHNGSIGTYLANTKDPQKVGYNSELLSAIDRYDKNDKGYFSAGDICRRKGYTDYQGSDGSHFHALPNQEMLNAIIEHSKIHDPNVYGPFQPISIFDRYWTSDTNPNKTQTYYRERGEANSYKLTVDDVNSGTTRNDTMRVRTIYVPENVTNIR